MSTSPPFVILLAMPSEVLWSYAAGVVILAVGVAVLALRGKWRHAEGFDKLILFGPLFYAAPLAAFGTEHFTQATAIASAVPAWIPWHLFWAYFVGICFIAAALSLVTGIQSRLSASLLALTFLLFVALIDFPAWIQAPQNRFALALVLRELSFSGGALALAGSLTAQRSDTTTNLAVTIARYFIAVPVVFYSIEQFLHGTYVPAIPLRALTPTYVYGHAAWTYLTAAVYAVTGPLLLAGRQTRAAATWMGLMILIVIAAVYIPKAVVEHTTLTGLNFVADTLMYGGAILLLAGAMPRV